jgi:signal transduction histidine kinase
VLQQTIGGSSLRLHEFIAANVQLIIDEWLRRIRQSLAPASMGAPELFDSLPVFLREIALALAGTGAKGRARPTRHAGLPNKSPIAKEHGEQRLRLGFDVSSIVREYFTLRTCVLELARAAQVPVPPEEAEILTYCIATGIADAVLEYSKERDEMLQEQASKHVGFLAHELRNELGSARLALMTVEKKSVGTKSRTFQILQRNLQRLGELIDEALLEARMRARAELQLETLDVRRMVKELAVESAAEDRRVHVLVSFEGRSTLQGDRRLLHSTLSNLIYNAVKFTREGGHVTVRGRSVEGRLVIDIEDECGGLREEKLEKLFDPFVQSGADRSGFGLGLAIAKQASEAHNGVIRVHNLPGKGCVFTLDLPHEQPNG